MDIFEIDGPVQLSGEIDVAGSKNACLPILAAALLAPGTSLIPNAPDLSDIRSMEVLLESLGAVVHRDQAGLHIDATTIDNPVGEYEIVRKMRASICILGPLLARCGKVTISMPGGCAIGDRPIDIHLRGVKALGAKIHLENGNIVNSVNFPMLALERTGGSRLAIANRNIPNMLGSITSILAEHNLNVLDLLNRSRGDLAYNLIDVETAPEQKVVDQLCGIEGVISVRLL
jgi:hypothetical protein